MKKRIISIILIVVMAIGFMPTVSFAASTGEFAGGSGTAADPYLISTTEHLNNVRKYLKAHFKMINDIEFTDADFAEGGAFYNKGEGWTPIGKTNEMFKGTFDGNGYDIKNIYINITLISALYAGLFGANQGTIKNLGLTNGEVKVYSSVVSTQNFYVGGIVGYDAGVIEDCYNTCDISVSLSCHSYVGGVVGEKSQGTMTDCYNTGAVSVVSTSSVTAGGIVGYFNGTMTGCYNAENVSVDAERSVSAGGIAGNFHGTMTDCYNVGTVTASSSTNDVNAGGIAGYISSGIIKGCYNTGDISATADDLAYAGGISGRIENESSIENLYNTGDVTASSKTNDTYSGGIFGYKRFNTTTTNCYNTGDISVFSNYNAYAGGIVAYKNQGTITNCYNMGNVSSSSYAYAYTGGIVGDNTGGTTINCYNIGTVAASSYYDVYAGGIAGRSYYNSNVENCYNTGVVSAICNLSSYKVYAGGIAGYKYSNSTITNCYYFNIISKGIGSGSGTTTGCTDKQLKLQSTYSGFDFSSVWTMDGNTLYPYPELRTVETVIDRNVAAKVSVDSHIVKVVNSSGASIAGAKVEITGLNTQASYVTSNDGYIVFPKENTISDINFTVSADGYEKYTTVGKNFEISETGMDVLTIYTSDEAGLKLIKAIYCDTDSSYNEVNIYNVNLIKSTKRLGMSNVNSGYFRLTCMLYEPSRIAEYVLYQNGKFIKKSTDGVFNLRIKDFSVGGNIYVTVFDKSGEKESTPLNLEIYNDTIVKDATLDLGNSFSFSVSDSIPFVGGSALKYKIPDLPITFKTEDGKVYAGINVDFKDDKSIKEQYQELKTLMEDVRKLSDYTDKNDLKERIDKFLKKRDKLNLPAVGEIEAKLFGAGEITWSGNGIDTMEIQAYLLVDASVEKEWQTMVSIIPVTIQIKVGVEGKLQAAAKWDFKNKVMIGDVKLNIKPYLNAFGGIGISKYIGVGAYGDADVNIDIQLFGSTVKSGVNSVDLTGELGLKAYAGPFTYKKSFAHNTWNLYTRSDVASYSVPRSYYAGLFDGDSYTVDDISYLQEQSEWLGEYTSGVSTFALRAADTSINISPLLENTYRNTQPSVAATDDVAVMTFVGADTTRLAQNAPTVMYSVYNADLGTWSQPVHVDKNATADASPMLYSDGETIRLVYQDASKIYGENLTPSEYLSTQNVVVYVYNKNTATFVLEKTFNSNGMQYRAPKLSDVNGTPTVVWIAGENCDIIGQGNGNTFYYSSYRSGSWSGSSVLADNINAIPDYAVGTVDNKLNVLYVVDADGEFTTDDDRKLMLSDGNTVKTIATTAASELDFVKLPSEKNKSFIWYADGMLNTLNKSGGVSAVCAVGMPESICVTDNKILVTAASKTENGDANSEVFAIVYNNSSSSYGQAVQLSNQEKYIESIDSVDFNGQKILVMTRKSVEISENDVTDNCELAWAVIKDTANLQIDNVKYNHADAVNNNLPLYVSFTNQGVGASDGCVISVQDENGNTVQSLAYGETIASGDTKDVTITLPLKNITKPTEYYVIVGNDSYAFDVGYADLAVEAESVKVGDNNTLICTVFNKGITSASGDLLVYESDTKKIITIAKLDSIDPGKSMKLVLDISSDAAEKIITCEVKSSAEDYSQVNNTETLYLNFTKFVEVACIHSFDNACDNRCNGCGYTREVSHSWGEYVYNNDAGINVDGTKTRTCSACGKTETKVVENTSVFAGGSGTVADPYLISTKRHLSNVRNYLNAHFKMTNDIEFTDADFAAGGDFYNDGKGWEPIGINALNAFTGTFDGNNFTIKNIYININNSEYSASDVGIFGHNKGIVQNLGVEDGISNCSSNGSHYAGGIVAYNTGEIINCYYTGKVSVNSKYSSYVGGIAGINFGKIENCYNLGDVSAYGYGGGITGKNSDGTIVNCYNIGNLSVYSYDPASAGGIVGMNGGPIEKCYNTGNVSVFTYDSNFLDDRVQPYAGGIVGYNDGPIKNSYNTGAVSVDSEDYVYIGGIVGYHTDNKISYCYNTGAVSVSDSAFYVAAGGIAGTNVTGQIGSCFYINKISIGAGMIDNAGRECTEEQLKQKATYTGFDFNNIWTFDTSIHPYPVLRSIKRAHSWSGYIYNNDAGLGSNGTEYRVCETCGKIETRERTGGASVSSGPADVNMPHVVMNADGNGVITEMRKSWATRVYWGYIGESYTPYKEFEEFRLMCGTDYTADFAPRDAREYNFTKKGYYRFVLKSIRSGTNKDNYLYKDMVYTFYYDGKADVNVPAITLTGENTVKISTNGFTINKLYYGNIGQKNEPYSWFNDFWGKALGTKTYTGMWNVKDGTICTLPTKGYYNFVIAYTDSSGAKKEVIYTTYAGKDMDIIKKVDGKAVVDLSAGLSGGKINKLYYGNIGTTNTEYTGYDDFAKQLGSKRVAVFSVKDGDKYTLSEKGYYRFVIQYKTPRTDKVGEYLIYDVVVTINNN